MIDLNTEENTVITVSGHIEPTRLGYVGLPGYADTMMRIVYPKASAREMTVLPAKLSVPDSVVYVADKSWVNGVLYISDTSNHMIRKVLLDNVTTSTLAGMPAKGWIDGWDTADYQTQWNHPRGLSVDPLGKIYVADCNNQVFRTVEDMSFVPAPAPSTSISWALLSICMLMATWIV